MAIQPDLDRLKSTLVTSNIQKDNPALYQVIVQLIGAVKLLQGIFITDIATVAGNIPPNVANLNFLTHNDESVNLHNSRQLIAGSNVTFDDTVVNQRIINVNITEREWSVLTDGDLIEPELVFAGGDVIMSHIP